MEPYQTGERGLASHLSIARIMEVNVNTYTATALIIAGRNVGSTPECRIRCISKHAASRSGIIFMPEKDDQVYLDWSKGPTPIIDDYVDEITNIEGPSDEKQKITPLESFGGEDKFLAGLGKRPYRWGPKDIAPGDKLIMGKLGNMLAVLSGGITILRGGPLSQIILSKFRDMIKIVSRRLEIFSDFGVVRFNSKKGSTSFELLGNSSARKSNAIGAAWDYALKLGGKNLFSMELMRDKFQLYINRDGHTTIKSQASATIELASAPDIKITGNQSISTDGNKEDFVTGSHQSSVRGEKITKYGKEKRTVSGAQSATVGGPASLGYMRSVYETIRGTRPTDTHTIGKEIKIGAGDYTIDIGNPLNVGTPSIPLLAQGKTGDYAINTFAGDINHKIAVKGDYNVSTLLGDINLSTSAGGVNIESALGDINLSTLSGSLNLGTTLGDISFLTSVGNAVFGTDVGDVTIKATAGGVKIIAGTCSLELGPAGVKLTSNGVEFFGEVFSLMENLATAATPGFGGPLSTVPQIGIQMTKMKLFQGA